MSAGPASVTAVAGTNIALVKYWGKRDVALNLPATGSLSLTLDRLGTRTTVVFDDGERDRLILDGAPAGDAETARVSAFLDRVRARAEIARRALVTTDNSVPTAAGLASSASGFAALALAAARVAASASAANPDADDARPAAVGTLFSLVTSARRAISARARTRSRNADTRAVAASSAGAPSSTSRSVAPSSKATVVRVPSRSSVSDRLPVAGKFKVTSRFPQYFTSAIFVPATAVTARGALTSRSPGSRRSRP